jgi:hypothetical protein
LQVADLHVANASNRDTDVVTLALTRALCRQFPLPDARYAPMPHYRR